MIREEMLRKKGWSEKEIIHAMKILATKRNVFFTDRFAPIIYWSALLLIIAGNLFVSVIMLPFLLFMSKITLFFATILIAAGFGALFDILVKDIRMTDPRHHVIISIFLPIFVLINVYVMIDVAGYFISLNQLKGLQSPVLVALVYASAFTAPSILDRFFSKKSAVDGTIQNPK